MTKCKKYIKAFLKNDKLLDLKATGSRHNNSLVDLLNCQAKEKKICLVQKTNYKNCHQGIMGTGVYEGRKHCALELESFRECLAGNKTFC